MCPDEDGEQHAKKKLCVRSKLIAVLPDEYTRSPRTEKAVITLITDKTQISRIVKVLTVSLPLGHLQHLKRVRRSSENKFSVVICSARSYRSNDFYEFLHKRDIDCQGFAKDVWEECVASEAPITRKQYEEAMKLWPVSFHENKYIEKLLSGDVLSGKDIAKAEEFMQQAIMAANKTKLSANEPCAAIVTDAESNILTIASDQQSTHPLKHAVMVAIDQIAMLQGGGAWSASRTNVKVDSSNKSKDLPYLCTNYDIYITHEPCIMEFWTTMTESPRKTLPPRYNRLIVAGLLVKKASVRKC